MALDEYRAQCTQNTFLTKNTSLWTSVSAQTLMPCEWICRSNMPFLCLLHGGWPRQKMNRLQWQHAPVTYQVSVVRTNQDRSTLVHDICFATYIITRFLVYTSEHLVVAAMLCYESQHMHAEDCWCVLLRVILRNPIWPCILLRVTWFWLWRHKPWLDKLFWFLAPNSKSVFWETPNGARQAKIQTLQTTLIIIVVAATTIQQAFNPSTDFQLQMAHDVASKTVLRWCNLKHVINHHGMVTNNCSLTFCLPAGLLVLNDPKQSHEDCGEKSAQHTCKARSHKILAGCSLICKRGWCLCSK